MRSFFVAVLVVVSSFGCGPSHRGNGDDNGDATLPDACDGLACRVVQCERQGKPPTTLSGTVFAPNHTLALYGATVFVPNGDPGPLADGATCGQCTPNSDPASVAKAVSDESGHFTLTNVPSGLNVPLVIQIGKWRRQVTIPMVPECTDTPLTADNTSLPRNKMEGDIPKIAITMGGCDALECLVRKIGIQDSEFTNESGMGRVHLFKAVGGSTSIAAGAQPLTDATSLWASVDKMKKYDIAMFSCECSQYAANKTQAMMDAVKAYADFGGRIFASHYHNVWIGGETGSTTHKPAVWSSIATCNIDNSADGADTIDTVNNPKGMSFQNWMMNVMGSTTPGQIAIESFSGRQTCSTIDTTKAERWVYGPNGAQNPQNFQFTTPNEVAKEQRCGKVVFSDMHVASGSTSSSSGFPMGCSAAPMTPQEKALAFMFFDISSCVGQIN